MVWRGPDRFRAPSSRARGRVLKPSKFQVSHRSSLSGAWRALTVVAGHRRHERRRAPLRELALAGEAADEDRDLDAAGNAGARAGLLFHDEAVLALVAGRSVERG